MASIAGGLQRTEPARFAVQVHHAGSDEVSILFSMICSGDYPLETKGIGGVCHSVAKRCLLSYLDEYTFR